MTRNLFYEGENKNSSKPLGLMRLYGIPFYWLSKEACNKLLFMFNILWACKFLNGYIENAIYLYITKSAFTKAVPPRQITLYIIHLKLNVHCYYL